MHVHGADLRFEVDQRAVTLHHVVDIIDIGHGLRWHQIFLAIWAAPLGSATGFFKLEKLFFKLFKFDFLLG